MIGGAVRDRIIQGAYRDVTLSGVQDIDSAGLSRWIPTLASKELLARSHSGNGVAATDMGYVFPNWTTWPSNARGPIPLL